MVPFSILFLSSKAVTLRLPLATYAEVGRALSGATGTPFVVAPDIAARKATLLCQSQPLESVMAAAGKNLGVSWNRRGRGFEMALSEAQRRAEADQDAADLAMSRERFEKMTRNKGPFKNGETTQAALTAVGGSIDRVMGGETVVVSSEGEPGTVDMGRANRLPAAEVARGGATEPVPVRYAFTYVPDKAELRCWISSEPRLALRTLGNSWKLGFAFMGQSPRGPLQAEEFAWVGLPRDRRPLVGFRPPAPEGLARCTTLGAHLLALGDATGLSVVAPASRFAVANGDPLTGDGTLDGYLRELVGTSHEIGRLALGSYRVADGWLTARPQGWWRVARREPSEAWLKPLERAYAAKRPMLEDDADAVGALTPADRRSLNDADVIVADAPLQPLRDLRGALALWKGLSPRQRRMARGDGLALSDALPGSPLETALRRAKPATEGVPTLAAGGPLRLFVREEDAAPDPRWQGFDIEIKGARRSPNRQGPTDASPSAAYRVTRVRFVFAGGGREPVQVTEELRRLAR